MQKRMCSIFGICCVLILSACSGPAQQQVVLNKVQAQKAYQNHIDANQKIEKFEAIGRIGYSNANQSGSAAFLWRKNKDNFYLKVSGPIEASGTVIIEGNPSHVVLTQSNGKKVAAKTPEALAHKMLGFALPVSSLNEWLLGIPAKKMPVTHEKRNEWSHISQMQQSAWHIKYDKYHLPKKSGEVLPQKVILQNADTQVKFFIREWKL